MLEKSDESGEVTIKKIIAGGAANLDGTLTLKDRLLRVDGQSVQHLDLEQVFPSVPLRTNLVFECCAREDKA